MLACALVMAVVTAAKGDASSYRYKRPQQSSSGVNMGSQMSLPIPVWLLYLLGLAMFGGIGYMAFTILGVESEDDKKDKKKKKKSKKKKKKSSSKAEKDSKQD